MSNTYGWRDIGTTHGIERELRPTRLTKEQELLLQRGNRMVEEFRIEAKGTIVRYTCYLPGWEQTHLIVCRMVRNDSFGSDTDYASYQSKLYKYEHEAAAVFIEVVGLITESIINPAEGKDDAVRNRVSELMRHYTATGD